MQRTLLQSVFAELLRPPRVRGVYVEELELGAPFVVVRLSDGSVGSSLNYPIQNGDRSFEPHTIQADCMRRLRTDPLLQGFAGSTVLIERTIAAAIATALSQPLLEESTSELKIDRVGSWKRHLALRVRPSDVVCQIGFGGSTDIFARPGVVSRFVVCDLAFVDDSERTRGREVLCARGLCPDCVELHASAANSDVLKEADVVCITGSALCNGTIDELLTRIHRARLVVLQGPSCSIVSKALFDAGIGSVYAPVKRDLEWYLAVRRDPSLNEKVDGEYCHIHLDHKLSEEAP